MVKRNPKGDYFFPKYKVWLVTRKRLSTGVFFGLPKKIIYPGFHFWTPENGLTGPYPSINETLSQRKDYNESH